MMKKTEMVVFKGTQLQYIISTSIQLLLRMYGINDLERINGPKTPHLGQNRLVTHSFLMAPFRNNHSITIHIRVRPH